MKVETSTTKKLFITDVPWLDPITVFLEDFGRRDCPTESNPDYQTAQGKITINCWDNSWNAYWGAMGPRTVAEFVTDCGWDYVLNCLDRGISPTVFSGAALYDLAKKCIAQRRRQQTGRHDWELGELRKDEARELWHNIDLLLGIEHPNECWHQSELLTELFGEEWHYSINDKAVEENDKFTYLRRVVEAVQKALRQEQQAAGERLMPQPLQCADEDLQELKRLALAVRTASDDDDALVNALDEYDEHANPDQVLCLFEVIDRITAERDALQQRLSTADKALDMADDEFAVMSLEAGQRMDLLEVDAARYRWLRERDLNSIHEGGVFVGRTPQNIVLNAEHLDQAIDAALNPADRTNTGGKAHCPNDGICHASDETCAEAQARIDSLKPAEGGGDE